MALGRQHRLRVSQEDARAITRAVAAEVPAEVFPERMSSLYFDRTGLPLLHRARQRPDQALQVRASVRSSEPEHAVVEVVEFRGDAFELQRLDIPRETLRRALRAHATSELLPSLPTGLVPSLRVTFLRERFARETWEVTLDRELAYRAQGVAPLREPDVVVTVTWWERRPPKWLARLGEGFPRY
ncbi:MAG: VTC domain-containing protein, partial [Myxococcaceae bacterium]